MPFASCRAMPATCCYAACRLPVPRLRLAACALFILTLPACLHSLRRALGARIAALYGTVWLLLYLLIYRL